MKRTQRIVRAQPRARRAPFVTGALTAALAAAALVPLSAHAATTITIATLNNPDMIELKKLAPAFEKANPDIQLKWVILEENVLRQRATTDITTNSGQFDVITIGTYEAPQWGKRGWLSPMTGLPANYDLDDVVKTARDGLSSGGVLYALPFYVESSMTYYRKDLFQAAGLKMPDQPTYDQIKQFADKLTDKSKGQYGICLRGKAGWGENMAFVSTVVNTFGGEWFNEKWQAQLDTPEWKKAVGFYADLLKNDGPPGASSNGFNENLTLMSSGKCAMWIDATVAAGMLYNKSQSQVSDKIGFAAAPIAVTPKGSHWLWSWSLAIPKTSKQQDAAKKFAAWATSKEYIEMVGKDEGWASVPPGTRKSTYARPEYKQAAPFGDFVLKAIETADPNDATLHKVPYSGIQFVGIPEFQSFGTVVGQSIAGVVAGQTSVDNALKAANAAADRAVKQAGYQK
ncbi:sugar ABC transporter substrate-binding protein [Caballeronia novacaledonica]|jgi:sorbitol/mannitol transport system substrate-binding protein|uniref:Sugar ABC transporter substrate-binding protein n=2 Tax=Caballeronia TaxID=1827195 RepID=A0ACB5QKF8_9BURK|nr:MULTISPECIES: sugar ABC transporter substrate-binding protein [Caballeronia]KAK49826.1 sugar ABC transporter substrate-binding protein [Caballeronia jiangsuensis]MBC8640260.1 sugar ABC transporter substrate-binding protein [Caballeronia sp. EK]MDR5742090.1 sugar ABC transporter substrate-binding protein [Caballeronia sp. LZ029]GJH07174.1 sugar ABC transporter substrate-binding protein [Caballeronia novacaledonica]GJH15681.1 sugar ABC transporter substrate-binding protein [Caballeronia novac